MCNFSRFVTSMSSCAQHMDSFVRRLSMSLETISQLISPLVAIWCLRPILKLSDDDLWISCTLASKRYASCFWDPTVSRWTLLISFQGNVSDLIDGKLEQYSVIPPMMMPLQSSGRSNEIVLVTMMHCPPSMDTSVHQIAPLQPNTWHYWGWGGWWLHS